MLDHTTVLACLDQCLAYFALLDLTGDGLITTREMARAERSSLVALQMPPAVHTAVVGKFLALDANRDGLITRREFVSALGATMAQQVVLCHIPWAKYSHNTIGGGGCRRADAGHARRAGTALPP